MNHGGEMARSDKPNLLKATVLTVSLWYDHRLGIHRYEMTWHCRPENFARPHRWLWRTREEGPCHIVMGKVGVKTSEDDVGSNWRTLSQKEFLGLCNRAGKARVQNDA